MGLVPVSIAYDQVKLYNYFKQLSTSMLEDSPVTYREMFPDFPGETISELKQWLRENGKNSHKRTDIIAYPDVDHESIRPVMDQIREKNWKTGIVAFFMQKKGEDVAPHSDYPYRKGSLLMLPIIHEEFQPTNAVTYYTEGESYRVSEPVVMDVMAKHGVKNVDGDRLMLHVELPELTLGDIT